MGARETLGELTLGERRLRFDNPVYALSADLAAALPTDACVHVLAYAGPNAADYYDARLDYLLSPRRVKVSTDSSATSGGCEYIAVFQDLSANLQADPFVGTWDTETLRESLASLTRVASTDLVSVYRRSAR